VTKKNGGSMAGGKLVDQWLAANVQDMENE